MFAKLNYWFRTGICLFLIGLIVLIPILAYFDIKAGNPIGLMMDVLGFLAAILWLPVCIQDAKMAKLKAK